MHLFTLKLCNKFTYDFVFASNRFDSYGSLWRIIKRDEIVGASQSYKVWIECSEIGEKPLYLQFVKDRLELTENIGQFFYDFLH